MEEWWKRDKAAAAEQPGLTVLPPGPPAAAAALAGDPWSWVAPGLRVLLQENVAPQLWQPQVARWPFDPLGACGPSVAMAGFAATPWWESG